MPPAQADRMRKTLLGIAALTALGTALALAAPARFEAKSFMTVDGRVQPAFAWCDAPDRIIAVTQPANADSNQSQLVKLRQVLKRPAPNTDAFDYVAEYLLGPSEGAAGSMYTALLLPGRTQNFGAASQYFIRRSNVENVQDPAYRMSRVNEVRTPEGSFRCRYVPQAVLMGVTSKRTVIIWDNGKTITYATRNFDGTPGIYVTGGQKGHSLEGGTAYEFSTKDGFLYRVVVDSYGPGTGFTVNVLRNGTVKGRESFLAYTVSTPKQN